MNSVSWFLYIAQVSDSVGTVFTVFGILGCVLLGAFGLFGTAFSSMDADKLILKIPQARYFALAIVFILIGCLTPDRNTMYAIAASEVGERVANSDAVKGIAGDATKALQAWISKQLDPPKSK